LSPLVLVVVLAWEITMSQQIMERLAYEVDLFHQHLIKLH
jgi:hypothetical protein